jgi:hypothetical protein
MPIEIVARFRTKESADKFAESANKRHFESVAVERQKIDGLWEVRLVPKRKLPVFRPPTT